jgi:hypothetical protein
MRDDACAHFRTGSFAADVALVNGVAKLAGARTTTPTSAFGPTV